MARFERTPRRRSPRCIIPAILSAKNWPASFGSPRSPDLSGASHAILTDCSNSSASLIKKKRRRKAVVPVRPMGSERLTSYSLRQDRPVRAIARHWPGKPLAARCWLRTRRSTLHHFRHPIPLGVRGQAFHRLLTIPRNSIGAQPRYGICRSGIRLAELTADPSRAWGRVGVASRFCADPDTDSKADRKSKS